MAAVNCSSAASSRRAKYVDDFRVPTLFGAVTLSQQEKNNSADVLWKRVNFIRVQR
jgi:hypothetical protein